MPQTVTARLTKKSITSAQQVMTAVWLWNVNVVAVISDKYTTFKPFEQYF